MLNYLKVPAAVLWIRILISSSKSSKKNLDPTVL
jgi:hypothetical protein